MKILVNPDTVPSTLDECLENIKKYLDNDDINQLKGFKTNPFLKEKTGAVIFLKGAWSLADTKSLLVQWFKVEYHTDNADEISNLILHCLYRDIREEPREGKEFITNLQPATKKKKKVVKPEE